MCRTRTRSGRGGERCSPAALFRRRFEHAQVARRAAQHGTAELERILARGARDLVLLFVFFDLTAVASYFLIGFDRQRTEARGAALMALAKTSQLLGVLNLERGQLGGTF